MKKHFEDSAAQLGQKYGLTALQIAGSGIMALGTIWQIAGPMMQNGRRGSTVTGEGLALGPIAINRPRRRRVDSRGIYELWNHWNTVWGWIKDAAKDVWDWISNNWPLLLDTVLFGPIGFAVGLIIKNFGDIKTWAKGRG